MTLQSNSAKYPLHRRDGQPGSEAGGMLPTCLARVSIPAQGASQVHSETHEAAVVPLEPRSSLGKVLGGSWCSTSPSSEFSVDLNPVNVYPEMKASDEGQFFKIDRQTFYCG